jgi:hypothetical protein
MGRYPTSDCVFSNPRLLLVGHRTSTASNPITLKLLSALCPPITFAYLRNAIEAAAPATIKGEKFAWNEPGGFKTIKPGP